MASKKTKNTEITYERFVVSVRKHPDGEYQDYLAIPDEHLAIQSAKSLMKNLHYSDVIVNHIVKVTTTTRIF